MMSLSSESIRYDMSITELPSAPVHAYRPESVTHLLSIARSYLEQVDHLVYSFGSKTFLSGYDLHDEGHGNAGNIDCSTFVYLVLAGIPYEKSPYALGDGRESEGHTNIEIMDSLHQNMQPLTEIDFSCFDQIPTHYMDIAERIGRPYLSCPRGLDMEKAEAMGISKEQLISEIRRCGTSRRSVDLAMQFWKQGACYLDSAYVQPGDLVFFQSATFFQDGNFRLAGLDAVTHVGIVTEDTSIMINSSGYLNKEQAKSEQLPAVNLAPIKGKRSVLFYARPKHI